MVEYHLARTYIILCSTTEETTLHVLNHFHYEFIVKGFKSSPQCQTERAPEVCVCRAEGATSTPSSRPCTVLKTRMDSMK